MLVFQGVGYRILNLHGFIIDDCVILCGTLMPTHAFSP